MTNPLSPAALAVVDAWNAKLNPDPDGLTYLTHDPEREALAAALRAAALYCKRDTLILLAIADELEAQP